MINLRRTLLHVTPLLMASAFAVLVGCSDLEQPGDSDKSAGSSSSSSLNDADKLRVVTVAMHAFHEGNRSLPNWANFNQEGKPLLSWRVHLLPYLGNEVDNVGQGKYKALYDQFHLDEPWDSPHNKPLAEQIPDVYQTRGTPDGQTRFRAPVMDQPGVALAERNFNEDTFFELGPREGGGENAHLESIKGTRFADVRDGTTTVIMLVHAPASEATPWTKPEPLMIDPNNPAAPWSAAGEKKMMVSIGNGVVTNLRASAPATTLKNLFSRADGNPVSVDDAK